ncbi:DUF4274 domain-containing protein [Vitreoscilla massiliensis]|uniref:DUF4274 domain-containing protein n=1 Tax=Vitreoscilla massiliensis TaxID=1689272 RepID=A0ABY4E471_9NEIS|nr:DUF4274 domain-containing protein [Vitreoscilla massiliensis]UOO90562.1 DUF4274 domain-containing protein [Vitreoscilla massiliensis]
MSPVDDIIHAYLQAASAEQRHVYVAGSNYDDNLPHLQYLAVQSDLDQATAKMMFWCLGGRYQAQFAPDQAQYQSEDALLCRELIARLQQGYYAHGNIYFDPAHDSPVHPSEYSNFADVWGIPELMYAVVMGTEYVDLDDDAYDDGLPLDIATAVWNAENDD